MAEVFVVDMLLYPEFAKPPTGTESRASADAMTAIDGKVKTSMQRSWLGMAINKTQAGSAELIAALNARATSDLKAIIEASLQPTMPGALVTGVSVAQPTEWTPTGGGYHESRLPVLADVTPVGTPAPAPVPMEWELSTAAPASFAFFVMALVRWKSVQVQ